MRDPFEALRGRAAGGRAAPAGAVDGVIRAGRARRTRALLGGGAGTALLVGVLVVSLAGGDSARQTLDVLDDVSPTATPSYDASTPSPYPTGTDAPSPSASPAPSSGPSASGASSPEPSQSAESWTDTFDDGKPGWSGGFSGCEVGEPQAGRATPPGLSLRTVLPRTSWRPGEPLEAFVVVTNTGSRPIETDASEWSTRGVLWTSAGDAVSAVNFTDAVVPVPIDLWPGESTQLLVTAHTWSCGDGPDDPEPRLAAGSYTVTFDMGRVGRTPAVPVALNPAAATKNVWPMLPRPVPFPTQSTNECESNPTGKAEWSHMTIGVEAPTTTIRRTETLHATIVVTALADVSLQTDPRGSAVYVDGTTPANSTGFDPGPYTDRVNGRTSRAEDDVPRLKAGDTLRYPVVWVPETCPQESGGDGTAVRARLAPGVYDVRFGLLTYDGDPAEHGFWFADETVSVTVTA